MGIFGDSESVVDGDGDWEGEKYEYKTITLDGKAGFLRKGPSENEDLLNELGEQGWELVETMENQGMTKRLIFMRAKLNE